MQSKNLRSNLGIQIEILRAVRREVSAKPTHILLRANLSHERLVRYLNDLISKGLISSNETDRNTSYSLTSNGKSFLDEIDERLEFLSEFGLSL